MPTLLDFYTYQQQHGAALATQKLFGWLSSEVERRELLADLVKHKAPLFFTSNASSRDNDVKDFRDFDWIDGPRHYEQQAALIAHPDHVEAALLSSGKLSANADEAQTAQALPYSNSPYQGLGGYFMLALDVPEAHDKQRAFALERLRAISTEQYDALATLAFKAGALVPLKQHDFDLVAIAEGIAARYAVNVFGFAQKDLSLVLECTRRIGRGLQYQIMGRHFVFEPSTMPESRAALAKLATRAQEIIHLFTPKLSLTRQQEEDKEEIDTDLDRMGRYCFQTERSGRKAQVLQRSGFTPILQAMAADSAADFGTVERGLLAASLVGGSVTNIQNAISICMAEFFKLPIEDLLELREMAVTERSANPDAQWLPKESVLIDMVKEALRVSPPVVYVPRRANYHFDINEDDKRIEDAELPSPPNRIDIAGQLSRTTIQKDSLILVALAGASCPGMPGGRSDQPDAAFRFGVQANAPINSPHSEKNGQCPFSKIMGGPPLLPDPVRLPTQRWTYTHSCPGMMMSMHVISYALRQLLQLPSLAQRINPDTGRPWGLEKRWGFQCTSYPMTYQRDALLAQTPLQTVLPIKTPIDMHSQALRQVLAMGAPFIEKVLQDSKMVHFASFVFVDNDSKLILFTMYDGDFDTYISHFAREFGHLFDRFFSHMAVQPTMPIREHPFEFVQYLKQFLVPPVENYYFSAYPETTTDRIVQTFTRQFDYNMIRGQ
jgi:cytochrome P450